MDQCLISYYNLRMYRNTKIVCVIAISIIVLKLMINLSANDPIFNRKYIKYFGKSFPSGTPMCQNMLENMTNGYWRRKIDISPDVDFKKLSSKEKILDRHLKEFRIKRGIHTRLWRHDGKCGYKNFQEKPNGNEWGGPVGAWCDANSSKPCCSNEFDGVCGSLCDCPSCVDMRKIYHAEISDWITFDARCHRVNYTSHKACDVVKKFKEIHFVGDSFVRKMSRGLVLLLRSDPINGATGKAYDHKLKKLCVGLDQFYWTECKFSEGNILDILDNNLSFCGDYSTKIILSESYGNQYAGNFFNLVKRLAGQHNTVIFLGVGGHDGCNAYATQKYFLEPALQYLKEYYSKPNSIFSHWWPHIVFMYPDTPGLLKSIKYQSANGKTKCDKFSREMKSYCDDHNIRVLDFSKLTSGVHSYDGTHHGMGVNIMKTQFMLNYLDSIL